jgi:hypothetical protein
MYAFSIFQGEQQYFMKSKFYPLSLLNESLSHRGNRIEFNRHFTNYYVALSKLMMGYVKRQLFIHRFNGDLKTTTEELWAEIFQEHYLPIFKTRPDSAEHLKALIQTLEPPSYGDLFKWNAEKWVKGLTEKIKKAMAFLGQSAVSDDEILEQRAIEINNDLSEIRQQGYELLAQLLRYDDNHQESTESDEDSSAYEMNGDVVIEDVAEGNNTNEADKRHRNALKQQITVLKKIIETEGEAAADQKLRFTGSAKFCISLNEILTQIPKILIPTTPMLIWLINNRVIDFMRRFVKDPLRDFAETVQKNDDDTNKQDELSKDDSFIKNKQEKWGFWRDVQALLQQPVLEARAYLQRSDLTKKQYNQAQTRLQRCEEQSIMHMAISEYLANDYTQEAIASELGLTRDQVRYRLKEMRNLLKDLRDKIQSERKHDE